MARGLKEQKALLKTIPTAKKASLEKIIETLQKEREQALDAEKVARSKADSIYWPIYNLDIKNPHVAEQVVHDPKELLEQYSQQQKDIQGLRDQLKTILSDALRSKGDA